MPESEKEKVSYADGRRYACTLGHFIGLLVDAGLDPAVVFRVVGDTEADPDGNFLRVITFTLIPDGYVREMAKNADGIHKTLRALLDAGVVK